MVIESETSPSKSNTHEEPAIENEILAYRAISPMAVVSLVLGLLSLLSFADMTFLVAAAAAIVTGILADRKIQRLPDMLTGRGLAQAGTALGLIFGLAAITTDQVQAYFRKGGAVRFANVYINTLKDGTVSQCLWFRIPPTARGKLTPDQAVEQLRSSSRDPGMFEQQTTPIKTIKARLASSPEQRIGLDKIERHGLDGLNPFALALLRLDGPASKQFPAALEYALIVMKSTREGGKLQWWVEDITYPYTPETHVMKEKPVDDGHGHGH